MKAKKIIEFIRNAFAFTVAIIYFPVWSLSFVFYYILKLLLALNYLLMLEPIKARDIIEFMFTKKPRRP